MVHDGDTTTQEVRTDIAIAGKDVAESIASEVEQATGMDRKARSDDTGPVVVHDRTQAVARITPLSSVTDVAPLRGAFVGDIAEIPLAARAFRDIKETAHAPDTATSHVLNAAINH